MCDLNVYQVTDKETGQTYNDIVQYLSPGFMDDRFTGKIGLYSVGATGCGTYFYTGSKWISPYNTDSFTNDPRYEFKKLRRLNTLGEFRELDISIYKRDFGESQDSQESTGDD